MMPEMDGIAATQRIREFSNAPIILLTAKSENEDKVLGLNVGADDYITKPFVPMEVLARVRSQLRRYTLLGGQAPEKPSALTIGGICLDDEAKTVTVDGEPANLTPMEFSILRLLMSNPGKVYSSRRSTKRYGTRRPWAAREPWRYTSATFGRKLKSIPQSPGT